MRAEYCFSPFIEQRKEKDRANATVIINYEDYPNWSTINNYLITGSRGTGKSSVLASFDYRTRWFNSQVLSYCDDFKYLVNEDVRDTPIIGIIFKADRVESVLWDKFYEKSNVYCSLLFSTYLSYYYATKILKSIKKILEEFYPEQPYALRNSSLIEHLLNLCDPSWRRKYSFLYDFSIDGLIAFFEEQSFLIRQTIYFGNIEASQSSMQVYSASSGFISDFCRIINEEIDVFSEKIFFLMIDDIDRFKDWQIRIINSFLKVTTKPCSWKLSSSLPYQTFATEDDARISGTDLKISRLNDESAVGNQQQKDRIDELYDAIFKSRLQSNGFDLSSFTSVKNLFGKMDLEGSIKYVVEHSLSQSLRQDYEDFKNSGSKNFTDYWLIDRNILKETDSQKKFDKYRVSATFAIVKANNLEETFQYGSYEIIRSLCSGSPRHFLRICDSMWPSIRSAIQQGAKIGERQISHIEQNNAIRKASNELVEVIDKDRFSRGVEVSCYQMCRRLADLFILLTHDEASLRRSQECLSVTFNIDDIKSEDNKTVMLKIVDKLTMLEVIKVRIDDTNPSVFQLGLNPMITPNYCISFRSPFLNTFSVNANSLFFYLTMIDGVTPELLCKERIGERDPELFNYIHYEE